jgi:acetyltransferase-like isoleucine patch superfamily enzyme
MSVALANSRTLPWDWYQGTIPENVALLGETHLETTYSFLHYRSQLAEGLRLGHGATVYLGTMFDVGPRGRVSVGRFCLLHGVWIICDAAVEIEDYALISWNVVLMDSYRAPLDPQVRRRELEQIPRRPARRMQGNAPARPIRICRNVWLGFDSCVLPGVTIGEGSIVGARSVVVENVPPFTLVAGNPARVIRPLENDEVRQTN